MQSPPPNGGQATSTQTDPATAAAERLRQVTGHLAAAFALIAVLGVAADFLQILDVIQSEEFGPTQWVLCGGLVALPVGASALLYWRSHRTITFFVWGATLLAALGGFAFGSANRQTTEVANPGACEIKPYKSEPARRVHDCQRHSIADGESIDIDDTSTRAANPKKGADLSMRASQLEAAQASVTVSVVDRATVTDGVYAVSYEGCRQAIPSTRPVDAVDLASSVAICVKTDEGRVAILEFVDYDAERQSAVFNITCWALAPR
ncbi:hypothetical protein O7635_23420 [Asanoa sp. WMMD1127]|uniref:hypothetical protein n=1 Tax=Asanoa sp. WMMD1127 TaxID=3016107 RepID=UPI002416C6BE|nr:hypothetical protein [Asanoa sp. WMMD1127]MDG4824811.1 hypothetical protein [Asanoa sp. WMMD1127]